MPLAVLCGRQVSAVAVAYATTSSSQQRDEEADVAVGMTLSQFTAPIQASSQSQVSQLQQQGAGGELNVSLEFISIPLLNRTHTLYHWTR